jgi:hypothetical protein
MQKSTLWEYWGSGEETRKEFPNGTWQEWYVTGHRGSNEFELMLVSDVLPAHAHIHSVGCTVLRPGTCHAPTGEYYVECAFIVDRPEGRISIGDANTPAVTWETDTEGVTWLSDFEGRRLYRKGAEAWQEEVAPLDYERAGLLLELSLELERVEAEGDWVRYSEIESLLADEKEIERLARSRCFVRADKATD